MRSAVIVPRAIALAKTFRYHRKTGTVVLKATCEEGRRWDEPTKRMTNATRANRAAISVAADAMILSARDAGSPRFPASIARSHSPTDRPANPQSLHKRLTRRTASGTPVQSRRVQFRRKEFRSKMTERGLSRTPFHVEDGVATLSCFW